MSPAPRNFKNSVHTVVPPILNSNNNNSDNNIRVPLPADVRLYLKSHPCIRLTELNVNKNKEVKKPLVNGTKVKLPISKMAIVHGILPPQFRKKRPQKDMRDDDSKKDLFLSALNLVDTKVAEAKQEIIKKQPLDNSLEKRLRSRKGQVVTFFKNNPLPITSNLGRKIISAGIGKCHNTKEEINRYEKYCSSRMRFGHVQSAKWPEINTRKAKLKKDQYAHTYSFGSTGRLKRYVELTIGMSERSFSLFNKCRDVSVRVHRMTDKDVARELMKLQPHSNSNHQSHSKNSSSNSAIPWENNKVPVRWISSEPIAGPSRAIEKIAQPVVKLYDIRLSPGKAKYFK